MPHVKYGSNEFLNFSYIIHYLLYFPIETFSYYVPYFYSTKSLYRYKTLYLLGDVKFNIVRSN